jgi:hypothetical protein
MTTPEAMSLAVLDLPPTAAHRIRPATGPSFLLDPGRPA